MGVYVVREDHYSYRIVIDDAIAVDQSLPRKEVVRRAIGEFSSRLENAVRAHLSNWLGWGGFERWP